MTPLQVAWAVKEAHDLAALRETTARIRREMIAKRVVGNDDELFPGAGRKA